MGDERAETYLRLLAEAELRRASIELRVFDAAAGTDSFSDPRMSPFRTADIASWKIGRAGRILVAAGVLDQDYLDGVAADLHLAINVRSQLLLSSERRRGTQPRFSFGMPGSLPPLRRSPPRGASQALRVTPVGQALPVAGDRASWTLHLMALVRTEAEALVTVAMRMHCRQTGRVRSWSSPGPAPIT
jgi:hypothetical protein